MTNLMHANREWATRPADERFSTLADLHNACRARRGASGETSVNYERLEANVNGSLKLSDKLHWSARLTHWSTTQLLTKLGVPRDLLTKLDTDVASTVVNNRIAVALREREMDRTQRVLLGNVKTPEHLVIRALHGDRYERLWDADVTDTLTRWLPPDWRNPVAFKDGKWGAELVPSGLYAGDRDMFAFFIDGGDWQTHPVGTFDVDGDAFHRGFFVHNSEVGAKSFGFTSFMFRVVCGNNIVWGAENVRTVKARHAGGAHKAMSQFRSYLQSIQPESSVDAFIKSVREAKADIVVPFKNSTTISGFDTLVETAHKTFKGKFTQTQVKDAVVAIQREEESPTGSRWDWLQGFTSVARTYQNADDKTALETKAAEVLF